MADSRLPVRKPRWQSRWWGELLILSATLAFFSWHLPPVGACASAEECLREIEGAQADVRTLSARFVQTKHLTLLNEPLISTGRLAFRAPDHLLWAIEQPRAATILVKGSDVSIPGLPAEDRRALEMTPMGALARDLGAMFTGSIAALEKQFVVDARYGRPDIVVSLIPRSESWKQSFRSIEIRFRGPDYLIREIRMEDSLGDRLAIELRDVRRNVELPEASFEPVER